MGSLSLWISENPFYLVRQGVLLGEAGRLHIPNTTIWLSIHMI